MLQKLFLTTLIIFQTALFAYAQGTDKPLRIISLSPEATEVLFALGLDKEIVGVTSYCNYPEQARSKEKVGTFSSPNLEKILSLRPDIIFATGLEQSLTVQRLRNLRFNVYAGYPLTLAEVYRSIEDIGRLTGRTLEAEKLIADIKSGVEAVKKAAARIPDNKRPAVFLQVWARPLITAGAHSLIDELITAAGGRNITHDLTRAYSRVDVEVIVKRNPDCIIMAYMGDTTIGDLRKTLGYRTMNAVKRSCVFSDINPDIILRASPRLTEGLEALQKRIQIAYESILMSKDKSEIRISKYETIFE